MKKLEKSPKCVPPFELIERIREEEKKIRGEAVRIEREKAKKEEKIEIAKGMKKKGFSIEDIIELTELTKTDIKK